MTKRINSDLSPHALGRKKCAAWLVRFAVAVIAICGCAPAFSQKGVSCGTDITNLSISIFKYTDATNTTMFNLWPDQTNVDGSPVPYVSGKSKGQSIDGRIQIDNCTYDLTLNLNFSKRYFTWKFPNGSVVGSSADSDNFNLDRLGTVPVTDGGPSFLNWCSNSTDNYGGCGVDGAGAYFVR